MKIRSKLMSRLLCLALCLCMVLAMLPAIPLVVDAAATCEHVDEDEKDGRCDVCGNPAQDVYLAYTTASLEGNIAVNYFLLLSDAVLADESAYMQFTMADGEVIQIPVKDSKLIDGYDVFTCEVAAKEMTDIITSQFYYGGEAAFDKDHEYNVRAYAKHVMENYDDANIKNLMEAMVNYGAASQAHFGHNTKEPANSILDTKPDYSNMVISGYDVIRGQGTENVKFYSASLILNSETTLRFFFNGNVTATYEGQDLPVKYRGGLYYVDVVDIAAKDLDEDVTITINDGTESANITFNPITYCQLILNDTTGAYTTEMRELVYALYLYSQAAYAYFVNDGPQGTTLKNALHNLNGNSGTITGQVTSVTFGRSNAYRDIANNYDGTLVDVEQEAPAYAYYVLNASGYDVYVLSNDVVYAPEDSTGLFKDMTSLTTVDTANLDVSCTKNMLEMFRNCTALTEVDVSDWDTGNVTNMKNMFRNCKVLPEIDVAGWDISKVTDMAAMFRECKAITELDTAKWNVSNVTNFAQTFAICDNLQIVRTSQWDTSSATTFSWMFYECRKLHTLNVSNWNTSKVTDMAYMFDNCKSLKVLDVSRWDTSNVTTLDHMFASRSQNAFDMQFEKLEVSNWDTSKVTKMNSMFYGCGYLTELDLSGWDVSKVTTMNHMFADCKRLSDLNVVGWDTSSVVYMDGLLNDCDALTKIDVSTFKTHNVKDFCQVFDSCEALTKIVGLENWDTSSGVVFEEMFANCTVLKELDLSSFNTRNALNSFKSEADTYNGCEKMFSNMPSLEKLVIGADFSFDGDGKVTTESYKVSLPAPANSEGVWYDKDGNAYLPSEIPEETAVTYYAVNPVNP